MGARDWLDEALTPTETAVLQKGITGHGRR